MTEQQPQSVYALFLNKLIDEAYPQGVSDALREQMVEDLGPRLEEHMYTSLVQALPNEQAGAFQQLIESGPTQEEVEAFFAEHIAEPQEVSARALMEFRDVYVGAGK